MIKYLSFPGLGISPFHIDDTAFTVFGIDVKWYGVLITLGMILAFLYARSRAKFEGITDDDIYDVTILCIVFGIIGARLYYIIFSSESYIVTGGTFFENVRDSFLKMINLRAGGLAIYGGIIAGIITAYICARVKRIRFPVLLDVAAPAVMIGQIIGRWGNFVNIEAYGSETELPWRMGILTAASEGGEFVSEKFVHPTFLYESLWNLVGFILVAIFYKKKKYNGQVFAFYAAWYGLGRFMIEGLRTDSLYIGQIRVSQLIGGVAFVVGTVLFFVFMKHTPACMKLAPIEAANETEPAPLADTDESAEQTDKGENDGADGDESTSEESDNGETD